MYSAYVKVCACARHMWRSEDRLQEPVLFFQQVQGSNAGFQD